MKKCYLLSSACACIYAILLAIPANAANMPIDTMNITGGTLVWSLPGGIPETIPFTMIGANTNLVGGYIGVGGSAGGQFDPPNPDNLLIFPVLGGPISLNYGQTYTAASNLGGSTMPAGIIPGGPVPYGTLDDIFSTIEMDLSSWFGNLNNVTDIWAGTGLNDGFTSPLATGTWNPSTYEYELTWNSRAPDSPTNPFPGLESTWILTGYAYPLLTVSATIDIKPGNKRNIINPRSRGGIWVAVLSDNELDPLQVDIPTVRFGPDEAEAIRYRVKDVNKDGLGDLLLRFNIRETGIACGDTETKLIGELFNGQDISGTDSIETVGCNNPKTKKKKHKKK